MAGRAFSLSLSSTKCLLIRLRILPRSRLESPDLAKRHSKETAVIFGLGVRTLLPTQESYGNLSEYRPTPLTPPRAKVEGDLRKDQHVMRSAYAPPNEILISNFSRLNSTSLFPFCPLSFSLFVGESSMVRSEFSLSGLSLKLTQIS